MRTTLMFLVLGVAAFAGCVSDAPDDEPIPEPTPPMFKLSDVGELGPEPSIGITSSGCMFFAALENVMRSCDEGESWEAVQDPNVCQPGTSDPYLWVDPATDRIFNVQMVSLVTTWICWSDDDGETWLGNPYDSGPIPVNDHIKVGSGPWTAEGLGAIGSNTEDVYPSAVYFCYNKLVGVFCYTSFDGGATFPIGGELVGLATTGAGLHGAITSAPDGTVYVPPRMSTPTVLVSHDNGLNWELVQVDDSVGTPNPRKNPEVSTDAQSNAYYTWIGEDQGVYVSTSSDRGMTWSEPVRISPENAISATFPQTDAGDVGKVAVAYLASTDTHLIGEEDIDGNDWEGNAHYAPDETVYHLYYSYSENALDANATWATVQVTEDPVQVGSICLNSGNCRNIGGSNRNLLDFNDLTMGPDGRMYIAYADGCTGDCATDDTPTASDSRDRAGWVAIQTGAPILGSVATA